MTENLVTLDINGKNANAYGHPSSCTEPAPGEVQQFQDTTHNITVTNENGDTSRFATKATANLYFPTHAHTYIPPVCTNSNDHKFIPDKRASSVTVNGSEVFRTGGNVYSDKDPGSGGNIEITSGVNSTVTITQA